MMEQANIRTCSNLSSELFDHNWIASSIFIKSILHCHSDDELIKTIQGEVTWCVLSIEDIALVDETGDGLNAKLDLCKQNFEYQGFTLSKSKAEFMECKFSK